MTPPSDAVPTATAEAGRPSISVVVPPYNLDACISAALNSVLDQTVQPDEVIVVDDGSADNTRERVRVVMERARGSRIRLIETPHEGAAAARNVGVAQACGDWVAFLDGDDLWLPEKLETVLDAISRNPDATMVAHDCYERSPDGTETLFPCHRHFDPTTPLLPQLYRASFLATSCVAVRTDVLKASGGFDPTIESGQDYDLWLRLARCARLVFVPKPLEVYIRRPGSLSAKVIVRYRCTLATGYRHAPWLVGPMGRCRAFWLRLRFVLIAHYVALSSRQPGRPARIVRVLAAAPWQVLRALITPIGSVRPA